ncbi:bifunctional metallophosphatase/5'-nucleotidase (plasmid) [Azospirillum baldaniorum]|uniref:5'-nucleotidase n=1 Tax=Azospirillum baldaniorum TaxID=1064539 RepID=A0A9P1NPA5_9PROT|nr:5'-nucleotidase C-terminal domain-containing protein [Azospirillum baldaniorum]AWJ92154.1 bifunctional metallophosphatase/5'-nucleotidase [Azospirillum baldaniorum]TWA73582.1 2',3'-cyclic-nucleotide 2'-phosphodiesterase (5'-nucleotidase family) [Azospirillum brasilense]CCD00636.1 putative 5'-nucleotidase [Azospirillum baldaniorum]
MPNRGNGGVGRFSGWRAVLAACAVAALGAVAPAASAAELSIVFTSTMADIEPVEGEGGLANLATLLRTKRAEGNTLFLHGGASLTAGVLSTFDRGAHMIDLLNELQPDMMAVTKRDLGFGKDELTLRSYEARFPFVSATTIDRNTGKVMEGLEPSALLDTPVGRIGVVSAISPDLTVQYIVPDIEVRPPAMIAAEARALRAQGADYVVAILDNAPEAVEALRGEPAIDALLQLSATGKDVLEADKGKLFGVHVNVKGSAFVLRLDGDGKAPPALAGAAIVPLAGLPPDPAMEKRVGVYLARLSELLDITIGTTATPLDTRRAAVRTGENAFASLIADAMRGHFNTDAAFINGGNIRGNRQYEAGTVLTRRDIQRELPFRDTIIAVTLPGKALREALEVSAAGVENQKGSFLHPSNMAVVYDLKQPAGSRVVSVTVGGKPLDPDARYSVALPNYLAQGGDGYGMLKSPGASSGASGKLLWEIMAQHLTDRGTVSPRIDGRITER